MCYGPDAKPPAHGRTGVVGSVEDLVLTASDGNRFSAHAAHPQQPSGTGIVVMPDVRGLYGYYCALADMFAETGTEAVAIDYFGRTAGLTDGRPEDFDYMPLVRDLAFDDVARDVAAAIENLRSRGVERVFTVGFCFGGAMSWRQSAAQPGLAGAMGFYGAPSRAVDTIDGMKAPLLMLLAGADMTPPEQFEDMVNRLESAGKDYRSVTYAGAPHSFFDRSYAQWEDACADSWKQIFAFMENPAA